MTVIGIDGLSARPGGGTVYLRNQVAALATRAPSWRFIVFCVPANREDIDIPAANVSFHVVSERSVLARIMWQATAFSEVIAQVGVNLLYCPGNFVIPRVPVPQVLALQNPNHFASLSLQPVLSLKAKRMLQRLGSMWSIRRAEATVFISHDYVRNVQRVMSLSGVRYRVIASGVDPTFVDPDGCRPVAERERPYVLSVSNLHRHKNLETLFRAFDHLVRRGDLDLDLIVVGDVHDRRYHSELVDLRAQLPSRARINLLGAVKQSELPELYRGAACYAATSLLEAFPLTPLEAMSLDCPVVIGRASVFPEICGDAALYCDPRDPVDVADALARLLTEPALAAELRRKGRERVRQFSWKRNGTELLGLFREVLAACHDNSGR